MKFCATFLLAVSLVYAQFFPDSNSIDVTGDAAINVAPDRVRLNFGVLNSDRHDGIAHANPITVIKIDFGILALRTFLWRLAFLSTTAFVVVYVRRV